ncbi:hypothetical protein EYF80_027252 [Liparis tanakae]|uniref:Uncharacterized protein n=1 Tax=Liparis tanakae TaxID=230148 RepID=A0A4Z2H9P4_9TELE|nr:hypothetical protein EYF80_027252 [Liparis tanakae]
MKAENPNNEPEEARRLSGWRQLFHSLFVIIDQRGFKEQRFRSKTIAHHESHWLQLNDEVIGVTAKAAIGKSAKVRQVVASHSLKVEINIEGLGRVKHSFLVGRFQRETFHLQLSGLEGRILLTGRRRS